MTEVVKEGGRAAYKLHWQVAVEKVRLGVGSCGGGNRWKLREGCKAYIMYVFPPLL